MKLVILLILVFSCQKDPADFINTYRIPKAPLQQTTIISDNSLPFIWEAPSQWVINNSSSSMRIASYLIPSSKGNADLSVIYLNGDGGGNMANVNRWRKQLNLNSLSAEEIKLSSKIINGKIGLYSIYEIVNQ